MERKRHWLSISLLAIAAVFLGVSLRGKEWLYREWAVVTLLVATIALLGAMICASVEDNERMGRIAIWVLGLAVGFQFVMLILERPGSGSNVPWGPKGQIFTEQGPQYPPPLGEPGVLFQWGKRAELEREQQRLQPRLQPHEEDRKYDVTTMAQIEKQFYEDSFRNRQISSILAATGFQFRLLFAGVVGLLAVWLWKRARRIALAGVLLTFMGLGMFIIRENPDPHIDVYVFQQESSHVLLRGWNPYTTTYTNIYGEGTAVYAKELQKNGRVLFGFPYMPLSLLMVVPGYALGDFRLGQLIALVGAAAFIAFSARGLVNLLAALLLLTTSRVFMVLELGWTEPLAVLWLAATVWCACRRPKWAPIALGLLIATKQYLIFVVPVAALLVMPRFSWKGYLKLLIKAGLVAALVSLPMMLWNWPAFWRSAVTLQLHQPLREDALSFLIWFYWHVNAAVAQKMWWVAFAGMGSMTVLAIKFWPRGGGGFAGAVAVVLFAFFALNKQAFANYYFFVIAAMCCAIAGLGCATREVGRAHPTTATERN